MIAASLLDANVQAQILPAYTRNTRQQNFPEPILYL